MKSLSITPVLSLITLEQRALLTCIATGASNHIKFLDDSLTKTVEGTCFNGGPNGWLEVFSILAFNEKGVPVDAGYREEASEWQFVLVAKNDRQSLLESFLNKEIPHVPYCAAKESIESIEVPTGFRIGSQYVYDDKHEKIVIDVPYAVFLSQNFISDSVQKFAVEVTISSNTVLHFLDDAGQLNKGEETIIETNHDITHKPLLNDEMIVWYESRISLSTAPVNILFVYSSLRSVTCMDEYAKEAIIL